MSDCFAVVVVNHNGGDDVVECLTSVRAESPKEIVIVDNASDDGSDGAMQEIAEAFDRVIFIRNDRNIGFAAAANQGMRTSTAPYVFLLNPDATLTPGSLAALQRVFEENPRAAVAGALVRNPDGTVQPTKRAFPSFGSAVLHGFVGIFRPDNPGTRSYVLHDDDFSRARTVDWVSGPAMAVRREAFESVDGFDERYFFFVEDVDLCKRLSLAGWDIWFQPEAEAVHQWGGSWTRRPLRFLWLHQWNLFRYVRKFYRGAWVLVWPLVAAGLLVRFMLLALRWLITKRSVPGHRSFGDDHRSLGGDR